MKNHQYFCLLILIIFTTILCSAQEFRRMQGPPKGPMEDRITAYFKAFNSSDSNELKKFFEENLTKDALTERSVEQRLEFQKTVRADMGNIEAGRFMKLDETEINVSAKAQKGGELNYKFIFEPNLPHKIISMRVERTPDEKENRPNPAEKQSPRTQKEFLSETEKLIAEAVTANEFSGVVLISVGDRAIFTNAYSLANKEKTIANKTDTKFNLGSICKTFTQVAIAQLLKQNKISLDDKLGKFLPDYPNKQAAEKVTVRHLLTMTSGIGDIFGERFMQTPKEKIRSIKDYIPLFANQPLAFEPGTRNQYSNGGYILLGAIIEKATGKSYFDYVREDIFKPLEMNATGFYESDETVANIAEGYTAMGAKSGERRNNLDTRPAKGSSAGGGYSTAEDMLKFSLALQTGKIALPDGTPARKTSDGKFSEMAIGGGAPGINAFLQIKNGKTIIVLSNYDPPSAEKIGKIIVANFDNLKN